MAPLINSSLHCVVLWRVGVLKPELAESSRQEAAEKRWSDLFSPWSTMTMSLHCPFTTSESQGCPGTVQERELRGEARGSYLNTGGKITFLLREASSPQGLFLVAFFSAQGPFRTIHTHPRSWEMRIAWRCQLGTPLLWIFPLATELCPLVFYFAGFWTGRRQRPLCYRPSPLTNVMPPTSWISDRREGIWTSRFSTNFPYPISISSLGL